MRQSIGFFPVLIFNFSSGEDDLFPFPPVVGINKYKLSFVITKMLSGAEPRLGEDFLLLGS